MTNPPFAAHLRLLPYPSQRKQANESATCSDLALVGTAQGKYPVGGSTYTVDITFDGDLAVGPSEVPESDYDPTLQYV